jgi:hypothetical protein
MREQGRVSTQQVVRALGFDKGTASRMLHRLVQAERARRDMNESDEATYTLITKDTRMKTLTLALLLAACGDNIVAGPDGGVDLPVGEFPDENFDFSDVDAGVDAPAPDAALPECEDKHIEQNGHEHKCQHDQ